MIDPTLVDFRSQQSLGASHKFGPGVDPEGDWSKWNCLYPQYINSKKKISEGRRVAETKGVENPTAEEMGLICAHLNLPYVVEFHKAYPRDWLYLGRIRVLLKDGSGKPQNDSVKNKRELMVKMGELIPQLKLRHVVAAAASSSSSHPPVTAAAAATKGKKKKKH